MKYFENIFIIILIVIVSGLFIARQGEFYVEDIRYLYQELDNRSELTVWQTDPTKCTIDENFLKITHVNPITTPWSSCEIETILDIGITYTLLYHIEENNCDNNHHFYLHSNGVTEETTLLTAVGIHSTLTVGVEGVFQEVQLASYNLTAGQYMKIRAVLFEGDLTGLSDEDKLDLIDNAEFGEIVYDGSYYYTDDLTMEMRIENIISIFFGLMVIVILGFIGFSSLKRK